MSCDLGYLKLKLIFFQKVKMFNNVVNIKIDITDVCFYPFKIFFGEKGTAVYDATDIL